MSELKYSYTVDVENPTTSHSQAVLLVAPGSTVLDIGAADGSVARPLVARGCRVWGIERDPVAAAKAGAVCERVLVGDVAEMDLQALLEGRRFDYILYLDVLEHLGDPLAVLARAREYLAPGGRVITSLPNITHGAVRLSLMSGSFKYTEVGLLDKTHLRFFDRRGAEGLLADAGLRIVERLRVVRGLTETEIPVDLAQVPAQVLQRLGDDPDATTYQFVFVAVPADTAATQPPSGESLAERLQLRVTELEGQYRQLETYARSLERQNRDQQAQVENLPALREELARRMEELSLRHLELRHLQSDLSVKEAFIADLRRTAEAGAGAAAEAASLRRELADVNLAATAARAAAAAESELLKTELADTRGALSQLQIYVDSPGMRTVASVMRRLSRHPRTYRLLQKALRSVRR